VSTPIIEALGLGIDPRSLTISLLTLIALFGLQQIASIVYSNIDSEDAHAGAKKPVKIAA